MTSISTNIEFECWNYLALCDENENFIEFVVNPSNFDVSNEHRFLSNNSDFETIDIQRLR